MNKKYLILGILMVQFTFLSSNNLQISNPIINVGASTISFTIQWDNSWNLTAAPANWDAVWVFIKRQDCADNLWKHALVSTNSTNHSVTGGVLEVNAVSDGMGVFIKRASAGAIGNIASSTVTLNLNIAPNLVDNFKVFGVEMVAVPKGNFSIGDGTRGTNNYGFSDGASCTTGPWNPKLIDSLTQVNGLGVAANYQCNNWGSTGALTGSFPLGWNNFYCMKYEISQEEYVSYLNSLTYDQQSGRIAVLPSAAAGTYAIAGATINRNGIKIETSGTSNNIPAVFGCDLNNNGVYNEPTDGQNIACNWLTWSDLISFLDWSALRPMTEFEFEKTCRGPVAPLAGEFPWSTTSISAVNSIPANLNNAGDNNETSTTVANGLCAVNRNTNATADDGPLRVGFAATATSTRVLAGATYYGVMNMGGNVMEQCVGGYAYNYSAFTNANGDGEITNFGDANTSGWPPAGGQGQGSTMRGSNWRGNTNNAMTSDRGNMISTIPRTRNWITGGRGVRSF